MLVACRKCEPCLRTRAWQWGKRAVTEYKVTQAKNVRTWFGTLTFRPEERYRLTCVTRARLDATGADLAGMGEIDRFRELLRDLGPLVTGYLKRLRKRNQFRYFLVAEPHQDWSPHFHVLLHEIASEAPVRKAELDAKWPHGFVKWRIVDSPKAAFYAAKYLGKFSVARVRASENYGNAVYALSAGTERPVADRPPNGPGGATAPRGELVELARQVTKGRMGTDL